MKTEQVWNRIYLADADDEEHRIFYCRSVCMYMQQDQTFVSSWPHLDRLWVSYSLRFNGHRELFPRKQNDRPVTPIIHLILVPKFNNERRANSAGYRNSCISFEKPWSETNVNTGDMKNTKASEGIKISETHPWWQLVQGSVKSPHTRSGIRHEFLHIAGYGRHRAGRCYN